VILMRIETFIHKGVKKDGTFKGDLGSVEVDGGISISDVHGGCGSPGCKCSPGHWICYSMPRDKSGVVRGCTIWFDSREELLDYLGLADRGDYRRK